MNSSLTVEVVDDTDHDTSMMGDQATAIFLSNDEAYIFVVITLILKRKQSSADVLIASVITTSSNVCNISKCS